MPGKLDAFLKMSSFALGKLPKQGVERVEALMTVMAEDLTAKGIPEAAISRLTQIGKSLFRKGEGVPKSVKALAGSLENSKAIEDSLGMARAAWRGLSPKDLKSQWNSLLQTMESSGVSPRVIEGMKKLSPEEVARIGAGQTMSAFDRLGPDPFAIQMYRKILGKGTTTKRQAAAFKELLGEGVEEVSSKTTKALTAAGVPGFTGAAKLGREVAGATTGYSPLGAGIGVGLPAFFSMRGRTELDPAEARTQAVNGFMALGGTSSSAVLNEVVKQQELAARRQMVLQGHDPQLFSRVLGVLADTGQGSGALTASERQIGTQVHQTPPGRRSDNDVQFLLDQLLQEASGQF